MHLTTSHTKDKMMETRYFHSLRTSICRSTLLLAIVLLMAGTTRTFAAIAQRGSATTATVNGNTSLIITKPTGVVLGDVMIVNIIVFNSSTLPTAPSGWTLINQQQMGTSFNRNASVFYKTATGSEGVSYTFTVPSTGNDNPPANAYVSGVIVAFSGVDGTTPFDVAPGTLTINSSGSATVTDGTITTATNNAAVIMFGAAAPNSNATTWSGWTTTSPGALTELYDFQGTSNYTTLGAAWAIKSTAGATGTGTATLSSSQRNAGILIALKPGCTPPGAPTVTSPVKYCLNATANPLTATGSNLLWYTVPGGGSGSSTAPTPSTASTGTTSYYVSQTVGCESARAQIDVTVNPTPSASATKNDITCFNAGDGQIVVTGANGTAPYTYSIYNGVAHSPYPDYQSGSTFSGLAPGQYQIRVKDNNQCESIQIP